MWSFVYIKILCTCINPENKLQFTISISPKLWNNCMGFQCWPTNKNIAKKAIRFISNAKYNSQYYFKNMFLTHGNTRKLKRVRWATQRFYKMETNLPNNNNYEIKVKHTNSKYCRFCQT